MTDLGNSRHNTEGNITILVTSFNDQRVIGLVQGLKEYDIKEILIADGGSSSDLINRIKSINDSKIRLEILPGSIVDSREAARTLVRGDIIVFIDTDEVPSEKWLEKLIEPIQTGKADFTFGYAVPEKKPQSRVEKLVNELQESLYRNLGNENIYMGPMGNSAWSSEIFRKISFDTRLKMGGEDYDFTLKALKSGFRGMYVSDATLYHDQSSISSLRKYMRKRFGYLVGASIAYRNNRILSNRIVRQRFRFMHTRDPLELILIPMLVPAFILSLIIS